MEMTQLPLLPPQAHLINSFILLLNCKIITCSKFINDYSILSDTKRLGVPQKINYGGNSCFMTGTEEVSFLLSIIILLFAPYGALYLNPPKDFYPIYPIIAPRYITVSRYTTVHPSEMACLLLLLTNHIKLVCFQVALI